MPFGDSSIRRALLGAFILVCAVIGLWLATYDARNQANLFLFFLYSIPCEFVVSVAPHEPAVLYVARFHQPLTVALVAGAGTLVAEIVNYRLLEKLGTTLAVLRVSRTPLLIVLADTFGRAPFAALWFAGFIPMIPFTPLRLLVLVYRYPRGRYLAAAVSSRTARFYLFALAGAAFQIPEAGIAVILVVVTLAVTVPGVWRIISHSRHHRTTEVL